MRSKYSKYIFLLFGLEALAFLTAGMMASGMWGIGAAGSSGQLDTRYEAVFWVTFPYVQAAQWLRGLSLSGSWGNVLAIVLFAAAGGAPLLYGMYRLWKKRARAWDLLLLLLSVLLYWGGYLLVNPAFIDRMLGRAGMTDVGKVAVCSAADAVIICYVMIRFAGFAAKSGTGILLDLLRLIMGIYFAVLVYAVFGRNFAGFLDSVMKMAAGNQPMGSSVAVTTVFLFVRYLLSCVPAFMEMWLIVLGSRLAQAMKEDRYSGETVREAKRLARFGRYAVAAVSLVFVVQNLSQLLFSRILLDSGYVVKLPLEAAAFSLTAMILAAYIAENRELKQDHDMII